MRSKLALTLAILATALARAQPAAAEQVGFALNHYSPAERGSDWFSLESLDLRGKLRQAWGLTLDYAHHPLITTDSAGNEQTALVDEQLFAHLGGALVVSDRFRVGLNVPFQLYASGESLTVGGVAYGRPAKAQALGDLRIDLDARLLGVYGDAATLALGLQAFLPTGDRASYTGQGSARLAPRAMFAGELGAWEYAARFGVTLGESRAFGGSEIGSRIDFGGALGLQLANHRLVVGPEVFGNSIVSKGVAFSQRATPLEGLLGGHYSVTKSWRVGAAISGGITAGFGTPLVRYLAAIDWTPPVADAPRPAERPLPPADRDHDGIVDALDACADVPGFASEDPTLHGCAFDLPCPELPGRKASDPRLSHCPTDQDGDTVLDADDACPAIPGAKSSDPRSNGCPEPDSDGDGFLDAQDGCPNAAGPGNADPKRNGCPVAFLQNDQIVIVDQIKFKTGSAEILNDEETQRVLQAVLTVLNQHPEFKHLRVEGHTDDRGSAALNRQLSSRRAASVVSWLVQHGIAAAGLVSVGRGADQPIDSNATDEGRRNNRRVEFHIDEDDTRPAASPATAPRTVPASAAPAR